MFDLWFSSFLLWVAIQQTFYYVFDYWPIYQQAAPPPPPPPEKKMNMYIIQSFSDISNLDG